MPKSCLPLSYIYEQIYKKCVHMHIEVRIYTQSEVFKQRTFRNEGGVDTDSVIR